MKFKRGKKYHKREDEQFDKTPVEFPELRDLDVRISKFLSPQKFVLKEGKCSQPEEFLLSEVIEFEANPHTYPSV